MKVDPITLKMLLQSMHHGTGEMHALLREPLEKQTLLTMARIAHKLKGEAAVVGFKKLSNAISRLEDSIEHCQVETKSGPNKTVLIHQQLKKLFYIYQQIVKSSQSQSGAQQRKTLKGSKQTKKTGISAALKILAQNVSRSCGKLVTLDLDQFDIARVPSSLQMKIQDIVIQLIRNAITHGIESPQARRTNRKNPTGSVKVIVKCIHNKLVVAVQDDGVGIDLEVIRKRLINKYNFRVEKTAKLTPKALLASLFLPGFSTLTKKQVHAGRGVGLDLVNTHVNSMGGKINIDYRKNKATKFTIHIPLVVSVKKFVVPLRNAKNKIDHSKIPTVYAKIG
ncbi:Hpt domain-containing protein [Teredinibacter haidensis]|uniref:Hpt domain-containing protein n=1 Tax=Teredinibacter haidensis TaxID=2731755 RepID=UPI000948F6F1|nr:Hpt domain-containing protein [Teredinibacter haidensis]